MRFGTMEQSFPVWGRFAVEMAGEAGFQGIQITDGGGYLQPHPLNNGFVEYERFGLDLRRKDSFPLTDRRGGGGGIKEGAGAGGGPAGGCRRIIWRRRRPPASG